MIAKTAHPIFQGVCGTLSRGALLNYFSRRESVRYFPVIDETQTSPTRTAQVLQNIFEFNEEAHRLPPDFDWTQNPSPDVEWLILLHKFYYATGLGIAYDESWDERYARKWIELTQRWMDQVPPDFLPSDVAGRRIQNWISAHYYFINQMLPVSIGPEFYDRFLESLHAQVGHLRNNLTPSRNHRTLELWAIFYAAVVFPEFRESRAWREFAIEELARNAESDFLADGVHCELSTDYHHIVLRNFLHVVRLARMNSISLPRALEKKVKLALQFAMHAHRPDGAIPALSDGDSMSYLPLLQWGAELYDDEAMLYVATQGKQGRPPADRCRAFPQGGYYTLRSGWGGRESAFGDERALIFDCGPIGEGNHGHLDLLHFEASAYGQSLIVDPGRYTYHEPKEDGEYNWRVHFRRTRAHNTVVINDQDQARYEFRKSKFKISGPHPGYRMNQFVSLAGLDYLHGTALSHEYPAVHERKILFAAGEYWIVLDRLTAETPHQYEQLFHLSDAAHGRVTGVINGETRIVDAPHLRIASLREDDCAMTIESDWVSRVYGSKHPAPVLCFRRNAATTDFTTVLLPYRDQRPGLSIEPVLIEGGANECTAFRVKIERNGERIEDLFAIVHSRRRESYACDGIEFSGTALHVRRNAKGQAITRNVVPFIES